MFHATHSPDLPHLGRKPSPKRGEYALVALLVGSVVGWAIIGAFAVATKSSLTVFGVGSMVAACSILAGAFLGFIFGVPRTLEKTADEEARQTAVASSENKPLPYRPNTNLEQISDWLTKILVGAGLTQIGSIRHWLNDVGTSLAPGFGSGENAPVFATVTVLAYLLCGFLVGYLWTRLYLAGALQEADVETLAREISEIREQSDLDAKALALAIKQLNPSGESTAPNQKELNEAIKECSPHVKAQIFYQAQSLRQETWAHHSTKAKMERTIPIFRALIACDTDEAHHRSHGQLGCALKDQRSPDWYGAEAAFTKAIQIRGSGLEHDWVYYEFNRSICRIKIDDSFRNNERSAPEVRKQIIEDLQVAYTNTSTREIINSDKTISDWLKLNQIDRLVLMAVPDELDAAQPALNHVARSR